MPVCSATVITLYTTRSWHYSISLHTALHITLCTARSWHYTLHHTVMTQLSVQIFSERSWRDAVLLRSTRSWHCSPVFHTSLHKRIMGERQKNNSFKNVFHAWGQTSARVNLIISFFFTLPLLITTLNSSTPSI